MRLWNEDKKWSVCNITSQNTLATEPLLHLLASVKNIILRLKHAYNLFLVLPLWQIDKICLVASVSLFLSAHSISTSGEYFGSYF